jgi:hypothetical protein
MSDDKPLDLVLLGDPELKDAQNHATAAQSGVGAALRAGGPLP